MFPIQNTTCFLEAHVEFFKEIKGSFKTVVYDNTTVAVKKFICKSDEDPTDALLKLSLYYKFNFRFCNAYSGNEKIDISHFTYTLFRKMKTLVNSTAFKQKDNVLKNIYFDYFKDNKKEFILLLDCVGKYRFKAVDEAIKHI